MLGLFFNGNKGPNDIAGIELDVTLRETHERSAQITDHPVEGGVQIQDHISNDPRRLTLEGFITDTPLVILGLQGDRAQDGFDELERLYDERAMFTVTTGLRVYRNMAFESLSIPRTRESALRFTATMKQITTVKSERGEVPADGVAEDAGGGPVGGSTTETRDLASSEVDAGRQQGAAASEDQIQRASVLYEIFTGGR